MHDLLSFFKDRKVLITGNTGFKGSWLTAILLQAGSRVVGYALPPETSPSLYTLLNHENVIRQYFADIRQQSCLENVLQTEQPEIVIHLAGQPLVRRGYAEPILTFETNAMGTAYLLQAARGVSSVRAIVIVTTDKVYAEKQNGEAHSERDQLGGADPYSASKACAELITQCYQSCGMGPHCLIATARAGNVLGGGDWSADRLIPDIVRSHYEDQRPVSLRYPSAIRPWQHVLDPLIGYLLLAKGLAEGKRDYVGGWNFAPTDVQMVTVQDVVQQAYTILGRQLSANIQPGIHPKETNVLRLDAARSQSVLGWSTRLALKETIDWTLFWYRDHYAGESAERLVNAQIEDFFTAYQTSAQPN